MNTLARLGGHLYQPSKLKLSKNKRTRDILYLINLSSIHQILQGLNFDHFVLLYIVHVMLGRRHTTSSFFLWRGLF